MTSAASRSSVASDARSWVNSTTWPNPSDRRSSVQRGRRWLAGRADQTCRRGARNPVHRNAVRRPRRTSGSVAWSGASAMTASTDITMLGGVAADVGTDGVAAPSACARVRRVRRWGRSTRRRSGRPAAGCTSRRRRRRRSAGRGCCTGPGTIGMSSHDVVACPAKSMRSGWRRPAFRISSVSPEPLGPLG